MEDSSNIHGEDLMDVRLGNSRSRHNPGSFNPWDKVCGNYEVCCKGKCRADHEREHQKQKQNTNVPASKESSSTICPGDFTGLIFII